MSGGPRFVDDYAMIMNGFCTLDNKSKCIPVKRGMERVKFNKKEQSQKNKKNNKSTETPISKWKLSSHE